MEIIGVGAPAPAYAFGNAGNAVHFALAVASTALSALPGALRRRGAKVKCMGDSMRRATW